MVLLGLVVVLSRVAPGLGTLLLSVAGALLLVPHAAFTWLRAWRTGGGPALVVGTGTAAAAY